MLSDLRKLYEVVSPQVLVLYMDTQECHIQVRCTGSIKTLIILVSLENLHMKE
jgi:SpoU rRNA methylase family enzyme